MINVEAIVSAGTLAFTHWQQLPPKRITRRSSQCCKRLLTHSRHHMSVRRNFDATQRFIASLFVKSMQMRGYITINDRKLDVSWLQWVPLPLWRDRYFVLLSCFECSCKHMGWQYGLKLERMSANLTSWRHSEASTSRPLAMTNIQPLSRGFRGRESLAYTQIQGPGIVCCRFRSFWSHQYMCLMHMSQAFSKTSTRHMPIY